MSWWPNAASPGIGYWTGPRGSNTWRSFVVEPPDEQWLGRTPSGTAILFLAAVLGLSFYWTWKGKWEGAVTGIFAGAYLLVVGTLSWLYTGDPTAFIMDSVRGSLTILFGLQVYRSLKNN